MWCARSQQPFGGILVLFFEREGHLGAATDRVADAVGVFGGDLAIVGDGEGVFTFSGCA